MEIGRSWNTEEADLGIDHKTEQCGVNAAI